MYTTSLPSHDSEFDAWSRLTTVTSFDAGSTQPMDEMEGNGVLLQDVKSFSSLSLLVESLIEQLCKLLEKTEDRQKALYNAICHKLHQMQLIDQTYDIEEFQFMRNHYQKALYRMLLVAKATAMESTQESSSSLLHLATSFDVDTSVFQQQRLLDLSRYRTEYEELEYIAKGGFGRVNKARNKLDGGVYAIKKICLRYRNISCFMRSLREVKMLAQLNHPNIVAYKAAWLEPFAPPNASDVGGTVAAEELSSFLASHIQDRDSAAPPVVIDSVGTEDSWEVEFKETSSQERTTSVRTETYEESSVVDLRNIFNEQGSSQQNGVTIQSVRRHTQTVRRVNGEESSEDGSSLEDGALCEYRGFSAARSVWKFDNIPSMQQREWATLYVQMQLCETTLRQWLDQRNGQSPHCPVDVKRCLSAFRQIVQGVEYIHSKGIVHHDIKPSNIFVSGDLSAPQVGDFGLACCLQHSSPDLVTFVTDERGTHEGEVGTRMYAAPEQLAGMCDPKSDLYSLGIILLELLAPFTTDMERCKVIGQLKTGCVPQQLEAMSPKLVELIKQLMLPSSSKRPTASQLISSLDSLLEEPTHEATPSENEANVKTIKQLRNELVQKDKEIEELKRRLELYERTTKES